LITCATWTGPPDLHDHEVDGNFDLHSCRQPHDHRVPAGRGGAPSAGPALSRSR